MDHSVQLLWVFTKYGILSKLQDSDRQSMHICFDVVFYVFCAIHTVVLGGGGGGGLIGLG